MNSINFYQGATILAAGLGMSFVTNYAGSRLAKHFEVNDKAYTNTIIKTVSFVAGAAAVALTARHLGVISFKNFSFQSKAQDAPVAALLDKSSNSEAFSYFTPKAYAEYEKMLSLLLKYHQADLRFHDSV